MRRWALLQGQNILYRVGGISATIKLPVYGTYLEGADIHQVDFGSGGLILIGNESKGIHPELEKFVTQKVTIPKSGKAESLNAAIARESFYFSSEVSF